MSNFEHDKTLIVGFDMARGPDWTVIASYEMLPGDIVLRHSMLSIEWLCPCGASGPGFPPEHHASGSCEATRSIVPLPGYVDGGGI